MEERKGKNFDGNEAALITIIVLLVVGFFIFSGSFLFRGHGGTRPRARRISCASNLKQIGLALKQYSMDYDDHFPELDDAEGFERLRSLDYLTDYKIYVCPNSSTAPASGTMPLRDLNVSYYYRGGLTEADSADSAIAWDKPENHKNYGNILFIDGHVEGFAGPNWMDNIK